MIKKIIKAAVSIAGASLGYGLGILINQLLTEQKLVSIPWHSEITALVINISLAIIFFFIFFITSPWITNSSMRVAKYTEKELQKIPSNEIVTGTIGLIIGLTIAFLLSALIKNLVGTNVILSIASVALYAFFSYLGISIATRNFGDLSRLGEIYKNSSPTKKSNKIRPKILDTSVIIDGRIADICKTGFIEGEIIIPEFVLEELRHIADSADGLKRNRGRRGLDILNKIQKELHMDVVISEQDFEDVSEVDVKLLKLAQKLDGIVVTNDFNLNKVAGIQGVEILNINELANAVKPVVLPGEEMDIMVMKEGKENKQGLAYLDDGTMIVVEEGKRYINQEIKVIVTSVLQTAAGRMIFARPK